MGYVITNHITFGTDQNCGGSMGILQKKLIVSNIWHGKPYITYIITAVFYEIWAGYYRPQYKANNQTKLN